MSPRLSCIVPFCRGTRGLRVGDGGVMPTEWICSRHWPLVSRAAKAEKRHWDRQARKADARGKATPRIHARAGAAWERCKREAIETAAGIAA